MSERKERYITFKLTREFVDLIDKILEKNELGFSNRAEVIKVSVREYYEKMKKLYPDNDSKSN